MRASAVLISAGVVLAVGQLVWPLRLDANGWVSMGPVALGALALALGLGTGLVLGSRLYRVAVLVGLGGIAVSFYAYAPHSRVPGVPISRPTFEEALLLIGLGILTFAIVLAAIAIKRGREMKVPGAPADG